MAYYQTAPAMFCTLAMQTELYMVLTMTQIASGTDPNQLIILDPGKQSGTGEQFGTTAVQDWIITDPTGSHDILGHAKGLHMFASKTSYFWYLSFTILFESGRFWGSTLNVMGNSPEIGEWSIVGGTGDFSLARGTIKYTVLQDTEHVKAVYQLKIHAFYFNMSASSIPLNVTNGGSDHRINSKIG
ncbi:hypothetical protein ACP70R_001794 [Stipagrostis hirtigluma subsp. patula]